MHHVACFDLQAALPTLTGDISNICFKSKQFSYNFTVYDLQMEALGDVHCYLWCEGEGNEVTLKWDHAYCSTGCAGSFL